VSVESRRPVSPLVDGVVVTVLVTVGVTTSAGTSGADGRADGVDTAPGSALVVCETTPPRTSEDGVGAAAVSTPVDAGAAVCEMVASRPLAPEVPSGEGGSLGEAIVAGNPLDVGAAVATSVGALTAVPVD
jgi:hypothetical protein